MDQSAVLRATLNSLAMMNVADVINSQRRRPSIEDEEEKVERNLEEMSRVQRVTNPFAKNKRNE